MFSFLILLNDYLQYLKTDFMSIQKLNIALNTLESYIERHNVSNIKISKSAIAWHIDHSLKVINNVIAAVQKSEPDTYKNNFSFLGKVFFAIGYFPRGKAKAPKHVKPPEVILKEDLISQVALAKANIKTIARLDDNAYFIHPLFGNINTPKIYRFLVIHTNHHLKIINEIIKK